MYKIKEVTLQNKNIEKKRLIIEFDNPDMAIVAEFLMSDSVMMETAILTDINAVLNGEVDQVEMSGNRCGLRIQKETTIMNDLLTDLYDDIKGLTTFEINTQDLKSLILMWLKEYKAYYSQD